MFGSGIGELNVYIRTIGGSSPDRKIWGLTGDAGNNWYMAQAPVASSKPFKVCTLEWALFRKNDDIQNPSSFSFVLWYSRATCKIFLV